MFCLCVFPPSPPHSSPRQRKSNWLIQVRTIAPQIWEKLMPVFLSGPGDRRGVGKQRWLCSGQTVTQWNPFGTFFQVSTPVQFKKKKKWKQNKSRVSCTFHTASVRGEGVAWPLASGISDWWLRNLSGLFRECCWTHGRTCFGGLRQVFEGNGIWV